MDEKGFDVPVTIRAFSSSVRLATKARAFSSAASHPPAPETFAEILIRIDVEYVPYQLT